MESLRIQWVERLINDNFHSWKIIPTILLKDVGGVPLFHSNLALSDACKLKIDNYPEFYKSIVHLWIKISPTDPQSEHDILSQTLWNNKYILIKRKLIFFLKFYQKGINTINDLIDDERGFYTWNRLKEKYELDKGLYIKYACLLKALPANWRKFLKERKTTSISNLSFSTDVRFRQNSVQLDNIVPKNVYEILIQPIKRNPTAQRSIEALLQEPSTEWSLVYTLPRKVTIDTSTRIFQYKILNNILHLNSRFYKITITESPLCSLCGDDLETILHFFCHCSITQNLWTQMQNWLSNILDIPELTSKIVILGKCPCQGATDILINHIILMLKKFLYTHRKSTTQVAFVALKHYIAYTQKIEQTIVRKNGKLTLHQVESNY